MMKKYLRLIIMGSLCLLALAGVGVRDRMKKGAENVVEVLSTGSWGLSFQEEGKAPVIDVDADKLKELGGYYLGDEAKKKIYITFDA